MLELTAEAASHLQRLRRERGHDKTQAVRLVRTDGRLGLTFEGAPGPDDRVITADDVKVCLAPDVARTLDGAVIEVRTTDGRARLVARRRRRPKAARRRAS